MISHHVYFWFKPEYRTKAKRLEFEQGLDTLMEIDAVDEGHYGVPAKTEKRPVIEDGYDYALMVKFGSVDDHDSYQEDPAHMRFVKRFESFWSEVRVYDVKLTSDQ